MSEAIFRLVYYSRNRGAALPEQMAATIRQILVASRRNNARIGVTGALMFNAGCFAQVLEGPRAAVEHIFERIQQDERHGDVSVLSFGPVASRSFDCWSMGFVGESAENSRRYSVVGDESGYDPSRMTGEALFETLHRLVLEEEGVRVSEGD
jgi:FAD-dependent sensor of blue light